MRAADAAGRALSTAAVLYHGTLAELSGLSPTEWKALDLIQRLVPRTFRSFWQPAKHAAPP